MKEHNQEKKNQQGYNGHETIHKRKANVYENTAYGIDGDNVRKKSSKTNMDQPLKQNMALHSEPSKSKIPVRLPLTDITQATTQKANLRSSAHKTNNVALPIGLSDIVVRPRGRPHNITDLKPTTQTPTITSSPSKNNSAHKTNDGSEPIGLSDIVVRPRGRPRRITNTNPTTQTPTITSSPPKIHSVHKPNDVALPIGLSGMSLRPRRRPRKIENPTYSTHTPTIATTPSLLATPQDSNVVASSSGVSNITPRSVGRPRKFQKTTRTHNTNTYAITKDFTLTSTPRPRGRPPKSDIRKSTTTETLANTSKPAYVSVLHQTNIVEASTTLEGSTSGTHQQKGKNVRMKSLRRINFNDTDDEDEDEAEVESQINQFEGIFNEYRDHGDPIFGCESCGELLWHAESIVGNIHANSESYSLCCGRGKVMLPKNLKNPPKLLMDLINKKHQKSTTFIDNIRRYNSMFAFTSMGGKQDNSVNTGRGPYCYRIQGMNFHRMGALLLGEGKPPIFSQLYIYDTENEIENRIKFSKERDGRKYNLPTAFEVAALIVGDFYSMEHKSDIFLEEQGGDLQRISELHPSYLALQYPLLFPYAEDGYRTNIYHRGVTDLTPTNKKTRQFLADGYTMVESERISYICREQKDLRSETYYNLAKLAADPDSVLQSEVKKLFCHPHIQEARAVYTIEFQKKGLPHAHILLFLEPKDKLTTATHIDKYISAEIPDKDEDPELYQIVTDHMMHGPCGAIGSIKYLFKYINKGPDRVTFATENEEVDEISDYYDCRYLSAYKAAWRIYGFDIHYRFPPVETLPFHLPNEQSVIFDERDSLDYTLDKASVNETKFQAWMETNKTYTFTQKLLYVEFLKYYVWKHDEKVWQRRQKGERIGCIHHVPHSWGEMFYLRVLLNKFVYEKTWHVMATDVKSIERVKKNAPDEQKKNYCLLYIEHMLLSNNKSLKSIPNMSYPTAEYTMDGYNRLVHDELSYNKDKLKEEHKRLYVTLTGEQKGIYGTIMDYVDKNKGGMFFVYRYGGTGKTYLYKTISAACHSHGGIVLNVALSGIAALLLEGGRTAHSRFGIPINVVEDSMCNISADSELAELLRMTKLIIWDEAPMVN
ncbi:uncharacterized protein Tco_0601173 [Tanacetum coccineum]